MEEPGGVGGFGAHGDLDGGEGMKKMEGMVRGFKWGIQYAKKKNRKGRAMGGMVKRNLWRRERRLR